MSAAASAVAFATSALLIWAALRSPLARRVVAVPSGDRWHARETPALGGLGILAGLLAGVGACLAVGAVEPSAKLLGILGGCAILFAVGLADDVSSLKPLTKLAAQIGAAVVVLASGLSVEIVHNDVVATGIALVWLVGVTNAFNLLDHIDGLAGSLAAIACAFFAIDAISVHSNDLVLVVGSSLGLAALGFLLFNLRVRGSAQVFMGDSGSQVLGFGLAALSLAASWEVAGTTAATLVLPLLILAVPILDTTLVTVVRLLEGRPIYAGGRDHSSHRLVRHGLSEKRAVVLLALIAAGVGATSLGYSALNDPWITLIGVLITFAVLVQFGSFLADSERQTVPRDETGPFWLRIFVVHRRRLIEVLVDFALITAAFSAAYLLRFEGGGPGNQRELFLSALPVILAARYAVFIPFGLYSSVWRYVGARDATGIVAAVVVSELLAVGFLALSYVHDFADFSRSVFVIDALLCTILIGASRFGERALVPVLGVLKDRGDRRRTLIVGAGRAGRSLLLELRQTPGEQVVGFVDDDPALRRRRLQGVPVLGSAPDIARVLEDTRPDRVLVTIPDATRERLDFVVRGCAVAGINCQFVRRETNVDPDLVLGRSLE
ncbi:MAG: Gfo/Idh/MocA family oxidoreductase [Actinobacteria bacterium]|nr:Gfo/Idh/MocA family oxidoreductase [Actinomycetota bacterium]